MHLHPHARTRTRQSGTVLFVALILLVILSLLGVSAARMQTTEERMARNENNRQASQQAAEAGLRYGESLILGGTIMQTNCDQNTNGVYSIDPTSTTMGSVVSAAGVNPTRAAVISWSSAQPPNVILYAGPALSALPTDAQTPKIVVECLPPACSASCNLGAGPSTSGSQYRITSYAQGGDSTSYTILQSIYRLD